MDYRNLHPSILRAYDIRGIVGDTFSAADTYAVGRAFGTVVREGGGRSVAVGRDGRLSSPELEAALVDGLAKAGLKIYRIGVGPSPMLYFADRLLETDGALMITGSHNPSHYNGVKMVLKHKPFFGEAILRLGAIAAGGGYDTAPGALVIDRPVMDEYIARLLEDWRGHRSLRVAWDPGNGAAGEAVQRLVKELPGHHVLINEAIDGTFPAHHPDPTVEANLAQLKDLVARESCDLGLAFDGDGDRIGVVDGMGRVLWGDQLLVVLAGEVLAERPGAPIIADVKASRVFVDEIARLGGKPLLWKTGHSLIKSKMAEDDVPLAGEMSGHIFFADRWYGFDDALYAALRLLSILARTDVSLAEMRDALPALVNTPELRFDCPEDRKFEVVEAVRAALARRPGIRINSIDGLRVDTEDGWWLVRASNTQAVLVARCESATYEGLERLKADLRECLENAGLNLPADMDGAHAGT
ncbi:MAG: phosphomannomutase/phosphoglucomutase [Magnetospirillum sp. WYHS-4]